MKKMLVLVLLATFFALAVSGCGTTAASEPERTSVSVTAGQPSDTEENAPAEEPEVIASELVPEEEEETMESVIDAEAPALDLMASSYTVRLIQGGTAEAQLDINSGRVQDIFLYSDILGSEAEFEVREITDETVCTVKTHGPNLTISGAKAGVCDITASSADADGNVYTVTVHVAVNDNGVIAFSDLTNTGEGPAGAPAGGADAPPADGIPALGGVDETMEAGGIMFCGSSLMGGFDVGTYLAEDGYEVSIGNVTMGGTTIADFATAQQENIVSMKPGAIFINIGSVDVDRIASGVFDMQFMYDSYRDLLIYLRDNLPECNIYVMAYYPSQENTFRPNALVDQCNIWVEELAKELELNFVNVSDVLKNEKGYLQDDFSADGIHLTDEAYRLVYAALKETILESVHLK